MGYILTISKEKYFKAYKRAYVWEALTTRLWILPNWIHFLRSFNDFHKLHPRFLKYVQNLAKSKKKIAYLS